MLYKGLLLLISWLILQSPALAEGKKIILGSLEWPPYVSEHLPGNGTSGKVVRAAFKAVGYELEIRFYPWARTLDDVMTQHELVGYFPEYYSDERAKHFLFSDSIGKSPVGIVSGRYKRVRWVTLSDLKQYTIGVVRGYINTPEFDSAVARGELKVKEAVSDVINIRKVINGRLDMAVVDINTFSYFEEHDKIIRSGRMKLHINPHLLGINDLFVCFKNGRNGKELQRLFNEGLRRIHMEKQGHLAN